MEATLLFVDIVASTELALALGDARWRTLLDTFYTEVRKGRAQFEGWVANTAEDGLLAVFEAPAAALRSACTIRDAMAVLMDGYDSLVVGIQIIGSTGSVASEYSHP